MPAMMNRPQRTPLKRRFGRQQSGATLIEVLVSVLIFSFGLLGLAGLQSRAMQFSGDADGTNRAAALASELTAQMYTLRTGDLTTAAAGTVLADWVTKVQTPAVSGLAGGGATVNYTAATRIATIEINWVTPSNPLPRRYTTQFFDPVSGGILAP
jgi:type IV pilus assembly protein PilV